MKDSEIEKKLNDLKFLSMLLIVTTGISLGLNLALFIAWVI